MVSVRGAHLQRFVSPSSSLTNWMKGGDGRRTSARKAYAIWALVALLTDQKAYSSSSGSLFGTGGGVWALSISASSTMRTTRVIDSHLHVWADSTESGSGKFPYADGQDPPSALQDVATPRALLKKLEEASVDGCLIVQPLNHKFDHSYVAQAIHDYPEKFKGMFLHNPSLDADTAVAELERLTSQGFVGVRFNPYLWPQDEDMSAPGGCGLAVYQKCAALGIPVGVMCFHGLDLHHKDLLRLLEVSPETTLILDHVGFTALNQRGDESFQLLLDMVKRYPQVVVKLSALFRVASGQDEYPYEAVRQRRFLPLLEAIGPHRIMFGTDFPYVLEQSGGYEGAVLAVNGWLSELENGGNEAREAIFHGTAERLFGSWGGGAQKSQTAVSTAAKTNEL